MKQDLTTNSERRVYYVAGPMRGLPDHNVEAFDREADRLRALGHEVYNPADHEKDSGVLPKITKDMWSQEDFEKVGFNLRATFAAESSFICLEATHIFMLPGWSRSTGAPAERALGIAIGLVIEGAAA